MGHNRLRRLKRRERNREAREALLQEHEARERGPSYFGKVRKGDAVEVSFNFDQKNPVPFQDEKDPSRGLTWMRRMMKRLWNPQTKSN